MQLFRFRWFALCFSALTLCSSAFAQWDDIKRVGNGGETYVSADGTGGVYISSHIPVQVMVSKNWGETFDKPFVFPKSLGDTVVMARPGGKALVSYMYSFDKAGMATWTTSDFGATWKEGSGIPGRPLDREWPVINEKTNTAYLIYSDGYIGGPKSKGVFVSSSSEGGTGAWKELSRVDKEEEGTYAVDPHLVQSSDGKLYAFWNTSKDYNTVDAYKFAMSDDGGKTWKNHTTLGVSTKKIGEKATDTQERWMLGGLSAFGATKLMAFYVDYKAVDVYGETKAALVSNVRYSEDAGKTWTAPQTILNSKEITKASTAYYDKRTSGDNYAWYIQCLTWGCFDAQGRPHFVFYDNRDGQAKIGEKDYNRWHLRHAWATKFGETTVDSERVSKVITCKRPPLDFICCTADSKYLYVTWTETPKSTGDWDFSGEFYFGRKKLDE